MNFLPIIPRPRKVISFSNPLNGLIYHNSQERISSEQKSPLATISFTSSSQKSEAFKLSVRKANSNIRLDLNASIETQTTPKKPIYNSSHFMQPISINEQQLSKRKEDHKQSLSNQTYRYIFPQIQIVPLHLINKYEDISTNRLHFCLQKYYRLYFHKNIRCDSKQLNHKIQTYLPLLKKYKMVDQQIDRKKWPKEFSQIRNTQQLISFIQKYQKNTNQYWTKHLLVLIALYCIPHKDLRKTALEDILLTISKLTSKLNQKSNNQQSYVLISQSGQLIEDILDIPFSTKKLYFSIKTQSKMQLQLYDNFNKLVQTYHEDCKKRGFIGRLRTHFRKSIVPNKYDQETINYQTDFASKDKQRKSSVRKAVALLQRKNNENKKKFANNYSLLRSSQLKAQQIKSSRQSLQVSATVSAQPCFFSFHLQLPKKWQTIIRNNFNHYHELSAKYDHLIGPEQIYLFTLQTTHPLITDLKKSPFHSLRVKNILELLTNQILEDDLQKSKQTMTWQSFIQFSILSSKHLQKLIHSADCLRLLRSFVQGYLGINHEDYFRDQLTSKIYNMIQGNSEQLALMQEVIWSWLSQNSLLQHGAIQLQLLWRWQSRSRLFYLLMAAMILGTYKTTPLDLAYELLA